MLQGAVLYGHYGRESDFALLRNNNIDVSTRVVLVRAGFNSFAEKVRGGSPLQASRLTSGFTIHLFSSCRWPMQPT